MANQKVKTTNILLARKKLKEEEALLSLLQKPDMVKVNVKTNKRDKKGEASGGRKSGKGRKKN